MAQVTKVGLFDAQVCVPGEWDDDAVLSFAEQEAPCGTANGWQIRRAGSEWLAGSAERVQCASHPDHVHIMLDA